MMKRRTFLGGALTAMGAGSFGAQSATAQAVFQKPAEPLVWPVVTNLPPRIRSFAGHTDTVPDIVGPDRNGTELGDLYRRQSPGGAAQRRHHRRVPIVGQVAAAIRRPRSRQYSCGDRP